MAEYIKRETAVRAVIATIAGTAGQRWTEVMVTHWMPLPELPKENEVN